MTDRRCILARRSDVAMNREDVADADLLRVIQGERRCALRLQMKVKTKRSCALLIFKLTVFFILKIALL